MTIMVRAEVTTTEFDEGAVFEVESSERVDALLASGYLTTVDAAEQPDTEQPDTVVDTTSGVTGETIPADTDTELPKKTGRRGATD